MTIPFLGPELNSQAVDPEEERRKALAALQQPITAASATAPPPGVALNSGTTPSGASAPGPSAARPAIPLTFAQMQAQGIARPAPPPPPAPVAPVRSDIGSVLSRELANPGSFDSEAVKRSADFLGQDIDDRFNLQRQELNEDLIRRGVSDSSVRAARTFDTNVAEKSARETLGSQLLRDQALSRDQSLSQFLGLGIQRENNQGQLGLGAARLAGESEDRALRRLLEENRLGFAREGLSEEQRQFDQGLEAQKNQFADRLGIDRETLDRDTFLALLQLLNGDSFGVTDNALTPQGQLAPAASIPGSSGAGSSGAGSSGGTGGGRGTGGSLDPNTLVPGGGGSEAFDLARLDPRLEQLLFP